MAKVPSNHFPELATVANYLSESEDEKEIVETKIRQKKVDKEWRKERTFSSSKEAEDYIKSEEVWSFRQSNKTEEG